MRIKVCGLRNAENIGQIALLPIEMMGFIFYDRSPRWVGEGELPLTPGIKRIGVFVNADRQTILQTVCRHGLDGVQLHGEESVDLCRELRQEGVVVFKAIAVGSAEDLYRTELYEGAVDRFLFDTKCTDYGGSGRSFDWSLLGAYRGDTPFLLSGGINPSSVEAVRSFCHPRCEGVDLNSGFEISPGIKNYEQLQLFIQQLQSR